MVVLDIEMYWCSDIRPTINMEIPTAKYGKTTKNMEKMHVIMRVKMQWV